MSREKEVRSARPQVKVISDEELLQIWRDNPKTAEVARITGYGERQVRQRLAELRRRFGIVGMPDHERAEKFDRLLASINPTGPDGSTIREASVTVYGNAAFNRETGQWVETGLDSIKGHYRFDKPALVVKPFDSPIKAYKPTGIRNPDVERIFIIGDQQRGWWCVFPPDNPTEPIWTPFHDLRAIDCELMALAIYRPDRVVVVGDFFDFPQLSRFQQQPEWGQTLQQTINDGHDYFRVLRETVGPDCKIDFIPGNHETRLQRAICNNNPQLYNLTKPGERHSIYSIPSLMDFDKRGIECAAEFPSGEVWLASRKGNIPGLVATHADPSRFELRADSVHGHLLLPAMSCRQVQYEDGPVTYTRWCVSGTGNYSDTSDKTRLIRTNVSSGRSRVSMVQSFLTIEIDRETGMRDFHPHFINSGVVRFQGRTIESQIERVAP